MTITARNRSDSNSQTRSKPCWNTLGLALLGSLMLAACGGGGGDGGVANAPPPAPTYPAAPTPTPTPAPASASPGITVLAGATYDPNVTNGGFIDGPGATATFLGPSVLALDSGGNIFVNSYFKTLGTNSYQSVMRKVTPQGVVSTMTGFSFSTQFIIDGQGNFFGVGESNDWINGPGGIVKVTPSGQVTMLVPQANITGGFADGPLAGATFDGPDAFAVDSTGNIYINDTANCDIRKVGASSIVSTLAGNHGTCGHTDGTGNAASFTVLSGIAVDGAGNVYVSDLSLVPEGTGINSYMAPTYAAIRKIAPGGVVTTLAGGSANVGNADGTGSAATFYTPGSLTVDAAGNLYVTDTSFYPGNGLIRKITPAGVVTTVVGNANASSYVPTGALPGTFAGHPFYGIAWAGNGVLYALQGDHILKVQLPQ